MSSKNIWERLGFGSEAEYEEWCATPTDEEEEKEEPAICEKMRAALNAAAIPNSINEICCGTCGHYEMSHDYPDQMYAFVNTQTVDNASGWNEKYYMGFGTGNNLEESPATGIIIKAALEAGGLFVKWEGDNRVCLAVAEKPEFLVDCEERFTPASQEVVEEPILLEPVDLWEEKE